MISNELMANAGAPWVACLIVLGSVLLLMPGLVRGCASRSRLAFVALGNVGLALAFCAFLLPPPIASPVTSAMIVTIGADTAAVRRAQRARLAFATGDTAPTHAPQATRVHDLATIGRRHPQLRTVRVVGDGVGADAWRNAPQWRIEHIPAAGQPLVQSARWPAQVAPGERVAVQARVLTTPEDVHTAVLLDPFGGELMRAPVAHHSGRVTVHATPVATGQFIYRWQLRDARDTVLRDEPVPVTVMAPPPLNMLVLLGAPSFESRYMVAWARRAQVALASSVAVSQGRFRDTFSGQRARALRPLTPAVLRDVDLAILDQRTFAALDEAALDALRVAVVHDGMGLFVMGGDDAVRLGDVFAAWHNPTTNALGATQARWRQVGAGRAGAGAPTESFALVTAGDADAHARHWQSITDTLARSPADFTFTGPTEPARVDQVTQICAHGDHDLRVDRFSLTAPDGANQLIDARAHSARPGQQCAHLWPAQPGWHTIAAAGTSHTFYVLDGAHWRDLSSAERRRATTLAAQASAGIEPRPVEGRVAAPRWWFFILSTVLWALLWWEQKLRA